MKTEFCDANRRDFLKGLIIGAGGFAIGSAMINPREAIGQSIEANLEKASMERRWMFASGGLVHFQVSWAKMIVDTKGKEKLIEEMKIRSPQFATGDKRFVESLGITASDAKSAALMIPAAITIAYGPKQKYEVQDATSDKATVKCLECAFWNNVQAKKITDDLCSFHSRLYWESFAKAINPNLKSTMRKAKPLGDPVCEWLLELKA
jgi:hypothetical protein